MYCGNPFLVDDEIHRIEIQHSGSVVLYSNYETMLRSAVGFCKLEKWAEATELYQKMITQDSTDYRGWWGMFIVKTHNMTLLHKQDGVRFLPLDTSDANNAIKVAPPKAKVYLTKTLNAYTKKAAEIFPLDIRLINNSFYPQNFIGIQIDYARTVSFPCDKKIKLLLPKGKHTIILYGEGTNTTMHALRIYAHNQITIENTSGRWTIVSSQKITGVVKP